MFKRICALSSENIITSEIIEEYIDKEKDFENINDKDEKKETKFGYQNFNTLIDGFLDNLFENIEKEEEFDLHDKFISQIEKKLITRALEYFSGNQIKSSKILGINRKYLKSKNCKV